LWHEIVARRPGSAPRRFRSIRQEVIGIAGGDTPALLVDRKPLKIRLGDIDAPEKTQAFGERSKQSLSDLCFGRDETYKAQTIDKYGRTVARVTCGGIEANGVQVERGMARVYPRYNKDASMPRLHGSSEGSTPRIVVRCGSGATVAVSA
jgi:micrococcal nuclease